jgi:hypothetical protein
MTGNILSVLEPCDEPLLITDNTKSPLEKEMFLNLRKISFQPSPHLTYLIQMGLHKTKWNVFAFPVMGNILLFNYLV